MGVHVALWGSHHISVGCAAGRARALEMTSLVRRSRMVLVRSVNSSDAFLPSASSRGVASA
eukprot:1267391-Prymnesium_polylepis.1